ncbi:MFS transporter [Tolypothrix sp. PCC 7910]|uniref:MFS transporter n=1 Tax=Tolypothrix sp. PCC 7910 TaxID=2099387 RepID=UPI00142777BD|nr:MFS transporter [Tolypothrix sp. PCC 7910]QIR37186.1 MFS transporter [Tolypothrix sp. PCC 7910]
MKHSAFLLLCLVGGLAIFSSTIAKNPVLPILAQQLGATPATIGVIAAASTLTGILASFPAGLLSDYWGRKPLLLTAGVVFCSAPVAYLLVTTPWQLALVRIYHGLATAIFGPVAMAYVTDLAPTHRGERLGWYSSFTLGGRALAPVIGGLVLAVGSWQFVYILCAIAGILTLLGMKLLPNPSSVSKSKHHQKPKQNLWATKSAISEILSHRTMLLTSLVEAAQFGAFGAVEAFLPLYALSAGIDKAVVGLLFGSQVGVKVIARPLMGRISDCYGRKRQIVVGLLLTSLATWFFCQTKSVALLLLISAVFGLGIAIASAATSALVADLAPANSRGTALGIMSAIMDVGQALGPILLGVLLMYTSYQISFGVISALLLAAAMFFMTATKTSSKSEV